MKLKFARSSLVFGLVIAMALTGLRWWNPEILQDLRDQAFDRYQRVSPRPYEPVPVRIVDIDEQSLRQLGQWPWPRSLVAELLDRLGKLGAAVVVFDVLFSEADRLSPSNIMAQVPGLDASVLGRLPDNDEVFARQIAAQPTVLGFAAARDQRSLPMLKAGFAFLGQNPIMAPPHFDGGTIPLAGLSEAAAGIGDISMNPDQSSAVVRTIPLFLSDGKQLYPSLAMEALRVAQGASTYVVENAPERPASIAAVRVGDFEVPTTDAGELWLYMSRDEPARYISAKDILSGEGGGFGPLINGNIVFVGTSAAGLLDIRATALGGNVPGVSLHAQAVEQILTGRYLSRPDWADGLEILCVAALGFLVVVLITLFSPWVAVTAGMAVSLAVLLWSWTAFRDWGLLLDPVFPVAASLITQFATVAFRFLVTDQERRHIRQAFGQYVSPSVLARAENQHGALHLGGEDREITMMFMDVRDFTTISEGMASTDLVAFLNKLLTGLGRDVIEADGTLDKFIGDSIMAFWNAPVDVPGHPAKAARCALQMRATLREMNSHNVFGFDRPVGFGIGINTGVACVGNIGAENRFNYSAVGDAVNTTARIESLSKELGFDILVSEATATRLPGFALLDAGRQSLKGKAVRIGIYLLLGDETFAQSNEFQTLRAAHERLLAALPNAPSELAANFRAEAVTAAGAIMPELGKFYARLA